jgi:hypothetical protein
VPLSRPGMVGWLPVQRLLNPSGSGDVVGGPGHELPVLEDGEGSTRIPHQLIALVIEGNGFRRHWDKAI